MEDTEIEYLEEYKDYVLPGIKTSGDGRAATASASLDVASRRRRISSDSSGSSSIDPDIFQKLFDGKFLDDELNTESSSNAKGKSRIRRRLSSYSSDSNDAFETLYNQRGIQANNTRRERLESYDSIDDLGAALMGATPQTLTKKANSQPVNKSVSGSVHRGGNTQKSAKSRQQQPANKSSLSAASLTQQNSNSGFRANGSSSSSSSNAHVLANKKKAVTIIKAQKPDLNPPKHEPKEDPLHLKEYSDDADSDMTYTYEYESDFYGYGGSDDDDEQSKQVIDISTDSNAATSLADTVTPVVSDDESQQQQRSHTPLATNERLQLYLNNLSSAETPPSKNKHSNDRKSRSNEKPTSTTPTKAATEPLTDKNNDDSVDDHVLPMVEKPQLESGPSTSSLDRPRRDSETLTHAAVADVNLTYESLERVSLNLAEQIINIDMERSIEFEKRSGSKSRSTSASKSLSNTFGCQSHVRKLTYSNEKLNEIGSPMRRVKSAETFSKCSVGRPPKNRAATTEEDSKSSAVLETNNLTAPSPVAVAVAASPSNVTQQEPMKEDEKSTKKEKKVKKKRGRKKKEKSSTTTNCDSILQNQTSLPLPEINDQAEISNHAATCDALEIDTTSQLNKENEEEPVLENLENNVNDSSAEAEAVAVAMAEAENAKIAEPEFPTTELTSTMAEIKPEDSFVGTVDNVEAAISAIHSENETEVEQVVEARHVENSVAQCETAVRSNSNEIDSRGEFDNSVELNVSNVCTELNEQKENDGSVEQIQEILPNTEEVTETIETLKADLTETVVETVINNQAEDNIIIEATPKKILHTAQKATTSSIKRLSLRSASVMASPLPENKSTPSGRTSRSGGRRVLEETPQRPSSSRRSDRSPFSSDSSANAKGKKSVIPSEVIVAAETPRSPTVERPLRSSKPSTSAAAAATQQVEKEKSDDSVHKHSKKSNASKTPKADKDAKSAKDRKSRSKGRKSKKVNQTKAEAAPPAIIQETIPESLIEPNTEVTNSALPTEIVAGTSEESQTELSNIALPTEIIASANEESRMEILNSSLPTEIIAGAYEESQLDISTEIIAGAGEEPQTELITSSLPTEIIEGANELPLTELSNYSLPNEIFVETNDESHTELSNSAFSNESIAGTSVGSQMDLSNSVMPTMTTDVFDEVNQDNTQAPEIVEHAIGEESHIEVNTEVLSSAMQTEILVETKDDFALPSEIIEEPKQDVNLNAVNTEVVNAMDIEVPLTTDAQREGVPTVEELTAQDVLEQNLPKPEVNETVAEMVTVMEPPEEQVAPSTSTANEASLESAKPTTSQQVPLDGESTRRLTRSRTETPLAVPPKRARSKKSKSKGKDKNADETATNLKPPSTVKEQTSTEANKSEIAKETPSDTNNAPTVDSIEQPTNVQTNIDIQQSNETVHIKKRNTRNAKARNAASSTPATASADAIVAETPESILPSSTPSVGSSQGSLRNAKAKNAASSSLATASDAIVAETPPPAAVESSSILPSSTPSISSSQGSRLREVRVLIKRLPKSKMEEAQTKKEKNSENLGTEQALTNPTDQLAATPNDVEAQVETYPTQPPVNGNQEILPNLAAIDTAPIEMLTSEEQPPVEVVAQVDKPEKVVESKEEKDAPKRGVESKEEKDAPKSKRKRNTANSEKNQMGETSSSESKSQRKRSRRKKQEETPKPTETPTNHQPSTSTSESKSAQVEPQVGGIEQQSCEAQTTANEEQQLIEKQLEEMEKDDDAAVPAAAQDTQEQQQANEEKADAQADMQLSDIMENAAREDNLSVIQEPQQPDNETVEQQQQETEESVAAEESSSSQVETVNQEQQQPENQELETESEAENPTAATAATASATAATDTAAADEIQTESQERADETQEEVKQPDEEDETAAVQDQQIAESHEIEQTEENEAQLESTETTGVITGVDEGGNVEGSINSMDVDATQPDESIKRKMQGKQQKHATSSGIMAPPAPPKRDPSPSKAVRRRQANPPKMEVQPTQKRRKLHDTVVEYNVVQSSRNQETTIEPVIDKMPAAKATTTRKSPMPNKTKKSLVSDAAHPIGTMIGKKTTKGTKTPPPKTSLTSLLSPDEPLPAVDNSVIITKTSVKNATAEPPKPPTAAASGINISVSVMPEPQTSPKKTLTQAETVKRLISLKGKKLISPQTAPAAAGATAASSTNQKTSPASAATTNVKTSTASAASTVFKASPASTSAAATVAKSKSATVLKTLPASPAATVVKTSSASAAATAKSTPASAATRAVKPSPASVVQTVVKQSTASAATTVVKASPASAATKAVKSSAASTSATVVKSSSASTSTTNVRSSPATAATKVVKSATATTSATVDKSSSASTSATVDKSLPAAAVKVGNARKSLPAKMAAPQTSVPSGASTSEEARKMLEKSTTTPSNKKLESKPATSTSAVANRKSMPAKKMDATANNPSTSKEINKPAVAPAAATVDTAAASASKKTASKTPSKAKSKELLPQATSVPEVPETTVVATKNPTPETKQKAARATTARTPTVVKRDTAAATLATSQPTQQQQQQQPKRSVSNERQQTTETETQLQLQPKPQRQPRRPAKKAVAQSQDEAAPTETAPLPEPHATRKRKAPSKFDVETFEVKRRKQQQQQHQSEPAKNDTNVAFPVLITAASALPPAVVPAAIVAAQAPVSRASSLAAEPRASSQAKKPLQLPPQPLPLKMRKLRVRLNRSIVKNWIKAQQQQQQQKQQPAATVNVVATAALSAPRGSPAPIRRGARLPAAKAVPLPVPLPVLEVKCEQEELLVPQPVAVVAQTPMDVDVDSPVQVAAPISVDSSTTATPSSSSISSAAIPSASSSASVPNSIGNTKVYSYLYPTRCQRNFGAVGLDFCCPNLDGPMEAIDPTRLHAVVKAPVLELPQYLVITTKIVSEQDKNIPQKVRAKLEQLAAKDGLPKIVTTTTTTATPTPSIAPVAAAVAPPPPPAIPSVTPVLDRYNKKLPRGTTLTPKVHLEAAPAVPTPPPAPSTVASLLAETIAPPELLQLPPICPGDKQRMELQTRVEHLDAVVQSLVKRASTLTVTEREQVIERIVKTSTLEPIDVIVATKLLENYVRYINAVTDTVTAPPAPAPPSNAVFRSVVTPVTTPSTSAPTSAVSSSSGSSSSITQPALSVSLEEPPATIIMRPPVGSSTTTTVTASAAKSKDRRPIYDKQRNVIGYQYKSTLSKVARQPAAPPSSSDTSNSGSSGSRSSLPVASTPTPVATVTAHQQPPRTRVSLTQSASSSSKVAVVGSAPKTRSVAGSSVLPLKPTTTPSDNTKRFPQRKSAAAAKAPTAPTAKEKATPVGVVSGVPILNAATNPATNQNVIIVNQLLSQSEECILPDAIGGMVVAPAEIKGEVDDGEIIT